MIYLDACLDVFEGWWLSVYNGFRDRVVGILSVSTFEVHCREQNVASWDSMILEANQLFCVDGHIRSTCLEIEGIRFNNAKGRDYGF